MGNILIVAICVDNMLFFSNNCNLTDDIQCKLEKKFSIDASANLGKQDCPTEEENLKNLF